MNIECAIHWTDSYHENTLCFTNNIAQRDGGTHLAGFRGALTRRIVNYINSKYKNNINIEGYEYNPITNQKDLDKYMDYQYHKMNRIKSARK